MHFLLIIGSKEEGEGREERQRNGREEERERELVGVQKKGTSPTLILHNHLL